MIGLLASHPGAARPSPLPPLPVDPRVHVSRLLDEAGDWLLGHWLQIAIATAIGVLLYLAFNLLRGWGRKLCEHGHGGSTWLGVAGRALGRTGQVFMALAAARLVVGYSDAPPMLATTIGVLFMLAAVIQGAVWAREIALGAIEHRTLSEARQARALASAVGIIRLLVTLVIFSIAAIVALGNLGVNVSGLIAGLGIGGIAIGLAAQGIFADLFAALAILFDRPFRVGDSISYDSGAGSGTVEEIGLKSTRVRGGAGEERVIANKKLLDFEILNTTRRLRNRFKFDFFLGYATEPDIVMRIPELLRDAVESEGYTLVHGGLNGFAPHGLRYDVEFESAEADFPAGARDRVAAAILARFRDHGISFAYPTQVNLLAEKTKPTPPALPPQLSD